MPYIPPGDVHSPKARWHLIEVLLDDGPDRPSYALGTWDHERRIGFRWNGNDENTLGNPQSRGLPTWTMLDERMHEYAVRLLSPQKEDEVRVFLGLKRRVRTKVI